MNSSGKKGGFSVLIDLRLRITALKAESDLRCDGLGLRQVRRQREAVERHELPVTKTGPAWFPKMTRTGQCLGWCGVMSTATHKVA